MDYKVVSQQVVDNVGGLENIEGATHCVTPETLVWYVVGNLIAFIVPIVLIFAYNKAKGVPTTDEEGAGAGFDVSF